jgi:hypothetical protein
MAKLSYRFSIGNTARKGQVGLCFDIVMAGKENPAAAVEAAKKLFSGMGCPEEPIRVGVMDAEHVTLYVNPKNITEEHIVDIGPYE